jgi:hypothetical protein
VTPEGIIQELPPNADLEFRKRIIGSADRDTATKIVQWFFSDRSNRAISPIDETTVLDYVDQLVEEDTLESLRAALLLSPSNSEACAHLAELLAARDPREHPGKEAEASFYRRLSERW